MSPPGDYARLVEPARVHKSVYADPAVFDAEMERIFGRAWIYVGHESQTPSPGNYWTTLIGREPVIMVRGQDGAVRVLHNRCPHKGARIISEACGTLGSVIRCPYHGWMFGLDGKVRNVPFRAGYEGTGFNPDDPEFSLRPVARAGAYRGFVFCSLAADGPDLAAYLGGVASSLDNFVDRAPDGEVEVAGGVMRVMQRSNWKIFLENLMDTGHPQATHESSFVAARQTVKSRLGGATPFRLHIIEGNGEPASFWESLELHCFEHGHSFMGAIFNAPKDELSLDYLATLARQVGSERAQAIISVNRHNTVIYPSCSPHTGFQQLRVIRPIAVDRTMVEIFTFRLKGTSEAFFQRTINYTNIVNSPSSTVMVDDVEVYRRCQEGVDRQGGDWVSQHRQAGRESATGDEILAIGTSEAPIRNQYRAWASYMKDAH